MGWQKYLKAINFDNIFSTNENTSEIDFEEYRKIAREALEIQIPEKPLYAVNNGENKFKCPRCKAFITPKCKAPTYAHDDYIYIIVNSHCDNCGQRLNWAGASKYIGVNWSKYETKDFEKHTEQAEKETRGDLFSRRNKIY